MKKAKPIMIQGTMSNVGKSLIAAGLCRLFKQDGYRVAPFKSQNMALNSYITRERLEMGRAQAVQAEACGIEPSVDMNPILLKPTTDMGSQVILNGEVAGNMRAVDYFRKKKEYLPLIRAAYERLAETYDILVIEGAGSPAEINLKQDDIVNMGMAKLADAPVLLVGDIDRGGVFAQLLGTLQLLEADEQERVKGLIMNKFRGDKRILDPGLTMLEERCGKRVLGVVPWMDVDIEEEDSLAERLQKKRAEKGVDIAVIRFPKISNFTDFQAFSMEEQVSVRYVERAEELGSPDLILLPGTKNTLKDLLWLRQAGLEAAIQRKAEEGTLVLGICGGYQMLGERIEDPEGAEGGGSLRGMGLLPVVTHFGKEKVRTRREGRVYSLCGDFAALSGKRVSGYEIHMGRQEYTAEDRTPFLSLEPEEDGSKADGLVGKGDRGDADGCCRGNVAGTYLHGIFDEADFRWALVRLLAERKGLALEDGHGMASSWREYKERQYDRLAATLRQNLDMEAIYGLLWG